MAEVTIAPCSREAAKYAVMHWHYSRAMPTSKLVTYGVWEEGRFIGSVIFGRGASPKLCEAFDLTQTEMAELVRVALDTHETPVTQIVAEALRLLKEHNPGLRLVVSYADPAHGHLGKIYQAGNWIFTGMGKSTPQYRLNGRWQHQRTATDKGMGAVPAGTLTRQPPNKFRYLYPLDRATRRKHIKDALPYPGPQQLAEEVSKVRRHPSRVEGEVRPLGSAL